MAVLRVGLYYANTRAEGIDFSLVVFVILTNGILNALLTTNYVLIVRRVRLSRLDITRRRWCLTLLVSVAVGVLSWPQLQEQVGGQQPHVDLAPLC